MLQKLTAITAAFLLAAGMMPVRADAAEAIQIQPLYEPDQQTAAYLNLIPQEGEQFSITVTYHSPEREALVMYRADLTGAEGRKYVILLEPGDYTLTSVTTLLGDGGTQSYSEQFSVENPDYEEGLDQTRITVHLSAAVQDDAIHTPPTFSSNQPVTADGIKRIEKQLCFFRYARLRGDFDGDGEVTPRDATGVLKDYNRYLSEDPTEATPGQLAACDFNGNGYLDAKDATPIMRYFNIAMAEDEGSWDFLDKPEK